MFTLPLAAVDASGVNPSIGWQVILVIGFLLTSALQVVQLTRTRHARLIEPQPLEVREAPDLVPRAEFHREMEALRTEVTTAKDTITQIEQELRRELKEDVTQLHEKLNGIGREVSALTAANTLQNTTLAQVIAKLDRIAEAGRGGAK